MSNIQKLMEVVRILREVYKTLPESNDDEDPRGCLALAEEEVSICIYRLSQY